MPGDSATRMLGFVKADDATVDVASADSFPPALRGERVQTSGRART